MSPTPSLKQATQFHTTATGYVVTGVAFEMQQDPVEPATGSLNWLIYTDNGGQPDVPVSGGLIFNQDVSLLSDTSYTTVSTGPLNVALAPSTNYWIVLNGESLSSGFLQIQSALNPSGVGSPFSAASYSSGVWNFHPSQAIVGTNSAVPEPTNTVLAVIGAGLVSLLAWRRLRAAQATQ